VILLAVRSGLPHLGRILPLPGGLSACRAHRASGDRTGHGAAPPRNIAARRAGTAVRPGTRRTCEQRPACITGTSRGQL
jgi:hypothetical protein